MENLIVGLLVIIIGFFTWFLFLKKKNDETNSVSLYKFKTRTLKVRGSNGVRSYTVSLRESRPGKYIEDYDFYDQSGDLLGPTDKMIQILFDHLYNEDEYVDYELNPDHYSVEPELYNDGIVDVILQDDSEGDLLTNFDNDSHEAEVSESTFSPQVMTRETSVEDTYNEENDVAYSSSDDFESSDD